MAAERASRKSCMRAEAKSNMKRELSIGSIATSLTCKDFSLTKQLLNISGQIPGAMYQYQLFPGGGHHIPYASEKIFDIFGVTPEEATSNPTVIFSFVHHEDRDALVASINESARLHTPWQRVFRVVSPCQKLRWVEAEATLEKLKEGGTLFHCFARDVSERKILEEDLRLAQEALMTLVEERTNKLQAANRKLVSLNKEVQEEILERINLQAKLKESYDLLSLLTADLVLSEERERRRIAVELHDNVVQYLALGKLRLDMTLKDGIPPPDLLETLLALIVGAIQQIRQICNDLSPPLLYDLGLTHAIQSLGERLGREHHFCFALKTNFEKVDLSEHLRTVLYQTASELLINVVKHAHAKKVIVQLQNKLGTARLTVIDDGVGFPQPGAKGFGLSHVQQRIDFLKGTMTIISAPGRKTVIAVVVPLSPSPVAEKADNPVAYQKQFRIQQTSKITEERALEPVEAREVVRKQDSNARLVVQHEKP